MYAYVDETGNTGQNIFDAAQPRFLTAALATRSKFDAVYRVTVQSVAASAGVTVLHASELGPEKIEIVARRLLHVLKKADARFIFSNLEKKYLALTKIVDYIFDSGENLAVPWQVYNLRSLRLLLVFKLAVIVDVPLAKAFWDCLMEPKKDEAYRKYAAFCRELLERVTRLPDRRSREVISQALQWAIQNPDSIYIHSATKEARYQHLPNIVAFENLIDGIEAQSKRWHSPVKLIVHDEQMQFGRNLALWHEIYSNASGEPLRWPGDEPRVLRRVFGSEFVMSRDNASPGIQVIDVLLWLFKRMTDEKEIGPDSSVLLSFALSRAWYQDFSFKNVARQLQAHYDRVNAADIPEEQMRKALEMIASEKRRREQKIADHAERKRNAT
jgi:hypothetical protein